MSRYSGGHENGRRGVGRHEIGGSGGPRLGEWYADDVLDGGGLYGSKTDGGLR